MIPSERCIQIGTRKVGSGYPAYVIAEVSANHNGSMEEAARIIEAAAAGGADAVKFQTYRPDTITIQSDREYFRVSGGTLWDGRTLYDLYSEAYMPWEWQPPLKKIANDLRLDWFSSAFDSTAVDFLEELAVPAHKVASFEIVDLPLIRRMAGTGKPLIISTGMSTLAEVEEAVKTARSAGAGGVALLKCTSAYPAPASDAHLRTIAHMSEAFQAPAGLSDHTLGIAVPVAAVAVGACIIEKHLTMSRSIPGPDSAFSLEPAELKAMVEAIRTAEQALGCVRYESGESESSMTRFRRSLFVVEDIRAGAVFTERNVRSIRPGNGLHTRYLDRFLGQRAACDILAGTPLDWPHVAQHAATVREDGE